MKLPHVFALLLLLLALSACTTNTAPHETPIASIFPTTPIPIGAPTPTAIPESIAGEKLYWQAPLLLPDVSPNQRRAAFWISQHPSPDTLIMNADEIIAFNKRIVADNYVADLLAPQEKTNTADLKQSINRNTNHLSKRTLYDPTGSLIEPTWWQGIFNKLNLEAIAETAPQFALSVNWLEQRIIPDISRFYAIPLDIDFDEVQNSAYDIGTPFIVRHTSSDGHWLWACTSLSNGWVEKTSLAFCDQATISAWRARDFVVVTQTKADLYADRGLQKFTGWIRMGNRLPLEADEGDKWRVSLPVRIQDGTLSSCSVWILKEDASHGFLPYTPRTIINQAFKFLDKPYGWADMYGEQDCSRFIAQVFATVGIELPRNSGVQARTGVTHGIFKRSDAVEAKMEAVRGSMAGITLIRLDGHIMLYLGTLGDKPYVIHSMWAYRQKVDQLEIIRSVNRNTVSTLELGKDSTSGSLAERILNVQEISNPMVMQP